MYNRHPGFTQDIQGETSVAGWWVESQRCMCGLDASSVWHQRVHSDTCRTADTSSKTSQLLYADVLKYSTPDSISSLAAREPFVSPRCVWEEQFQWGSAAGHWCSPSVPSKGRWHLLPVQECTCWSCLWGHPAKPPDGGLVFPWEESGTPVLISPWT